MEFEKFLFRIHEFWLSRECCGPCLNITLKVSAILLFLQLPLFFYGNYAFIGTSSCLGLEIATNYTLDLDSNLSTVDQRKVILPEDIINVRIREPRFELANNNSGQFNYAHLEFSGEDYLVSLNERIKLEHNFTYHNITIEADCYATTIAGKYMLGTLVFDTILMNEIIASMKGFDVHIKNLNTMQTFRFSNEKVNSIEDWSKQKFRLLAAFFNLLGILFGLFLIFTVVALYIRIFYMYFPIWFFLGTGRNTRIQQEVIRQYAWIGLYFHTLQTNGKKTFWMFLSLYLCHLLFGRLVHAVQVYWNFLLFDKAYPRNISADFYDLIYWAEFVSLTFIRTRTSLKFVPRFAILFMVMFIYYFQHTVFGFYDLALSLLRCCIYGLFAYFLLHFEVAALHWNSSFHYTPSAESPRTLYFPIFSLTWMHDLPPIWTMFYPLFGRSHFTNRELSLVNGNYGLLRHTLDNAHNRGGLNEVEQDFGLGAEAPNNQVEIEIPNIDQRDGNDDHSGQNLVQNLSH